MIKVERKDKRDKVSNIHPSYSWPKRKGTEEWKRNDFFFIWLKKEDEEGKKY